MKDFKRFIYNDISDVRIYINQCSQEDHIQQVAYSTYHDGITQICFTCENIRTSIEVDKDE